MTLVYDVAQKRALHVLPVEGGTCDLGGLAVSGDICISFHKRGKKLKKQGLDWVEWLRRQADRHDDTSRLFYFDPCCIFYFYFHTTYTTPDRLWISVSALDKANKKLKKHYNAGG